MAIIDTIENFEVRQPQQGVTIPYGNQLNGNTQEIVDKVNEVVLEVNTITGSGTGLDSKTDKGGYTGTSKDLKDLIDLKQNITDNSLTTTSKTIVGGINEIQNKIGAVDGIASLNSSGKVPLSQMDDSLVGAVEYKGTWDASTNTPTLTSTPIEKGIYYVVSAKGTQFSIDFEIGD